MSLFPANPPSQEVIQRTDLKPQNPADSPSSWRRFVNFLRTTVGFRSLELADRYAEAQVSIVECDNHVKLLKAKAEFDETQARIRQLDAETVGDEMRDGRQEKILSAKARQEQALARQEIAKARIWELVANQLEAASESPDETIQRFLAIKQQIESMGGCVGLPAPEAEDEHE